MKKTTRIPVPKEGLLYLREMMRFDGAKSKLEKGVLKMSRPMSKVAAYSCKIKLFGKFIHKLH